MIDYSRLKAPRENLGLLIEPDPAAMRDAVQRGLPKSLAETHLLDRSIGGLRATLKKRLGLPERVIVTGHQAEFYHAGVFAKTVAAEALGSVTGAEPLFLTVDSDLLRSNELVVPQKTHGGLRRVSIPFTDVALDLPVEWQPPQPRERWLDVFTQAAASLDYYRESLLPDFVEGWFATEETDIDFCAAMARAAATVQKSLGLTPCRELRISQICGTPEFLGFAGHLVLHAADFARSYNQAQEAYRRRFHVRNPQRPVPPLSVEGGRVELPLWIYQTSSRRRRLHVIDRDDCIEISADRDAIACISKKEFERVELFAQAWERELGGWHLRPRALALSCFSRLLLGDIFIHGIGGARYDAVTEDFGRRLFGGELPPMACVTASVYPPLPGTDASEHGLGEAKRDSRDLRYNPQRHLGVVPIELLQSRTALVARSEELRGSRPDDHAARRAVFSDIRRTNELMLQSDPWRAAELDQRIEMIEQDLELNRIALDREYFYALQQRSALVRLTGEIRTSFGIA